MKDPIWELNIRPLFRALDRRHMLFKLDLWNYEDVKKLAPKIVKRVAKDMPTLNAGGPWPQEWIDLFKRWMTAKVPFARLALAVGTYTAVRASARLDSVTVTAKFTRPSPKSWIWFEEDLDAAAPFSYVLYLARASDPPRDIPDTMTEIVPIPRSVSSITMRDRDGVKKVAIT